MANRKDRVFRLVSGMDAWSLLICGGISLALSIYFASWVGMFVSAALIGHGWIELRLRRQALVNVTQAFRSLAINQIGLAGTITLYAIWQIFQVDGDALRASLLDSDASALLSLYPEDLKHMILENLPSGVRFFYAAMALLVWAVCGLTAWFYLRCGKKEASGARFGTTAL